MRRRLRATLRIIAAEPSLIVVLLWWRVVWPIGIYVKRRQKLDS
jgi:hypothetical protein